MGSLADTVLGKMDAINWGSLQPSQFADSGYQAMADGIYDYISDVSGNATVVCTATGTITPPVPPAPFVGTVAVTLTYSPASALKTQIKSMLSTGGTAPGVPITLLFTAIAAWLATPPVPVTVTGWDPSTIGPAAAGAGVAAFAALAAQAGPCSSEMLGSKPTNKEDAWKILGKYITLGLIGTLTVAAVTGTVGTAAFVGAGAGTITYK